MGKDVRIAGGFVELDLPSGGVYDISLSRMETEAELLRWVAHLAEKSWVTAGMLLDLIREVSGLRGFRLGA